MKWEYKTAKISELEPASYNPRVIDKDEFEGLKTSLKTFGFADPVVVNSNNNVIVGGHQRVKAWEALGNKEVPTMKPLNILSYLIQNSSKGGDLVFDNFLGSGSSLMACEQGDRVCYGTEIDPRYVDVIRKRYAKFTNNNELPDNWEELTKEVA